MCRRGQVWQRGGSAVSSPESRGLCSQSHTALQGWSLTVPSAQPLAPVSPCRLGQRSSDISQHKNSFHPAHGHHLLGTAPIFPVSGPIHSHVPQDFQLSPTSPFSSHLKQQRVTSPSQHSTFTTKLVVKWKFKGTFKNFINATWTYAFRLFIFKWDVTCNLVAILSIVFHF